MCRWIAYTGAPMALETFLFNANNSLVGQSLNARKSIARVNGDGFGVGWYGARTKPGVFRDILPAWSNENLRNLAHQIDARMFMAHVRSATGTPTIQPNCHPFAYQNMLFMHNGQIGSYEELRRRLENQIPDELFPYRQGSTDSELLFLLLVAAGVEHDFATACQRTIALVTQVMTEFGAQEPFRFSIALATGNVIFALRYASDNAPPTVFFRRTDHGVLLVSEPLDDDTEQWHALKNGQYLQVGQDYTPVPQEIF